MGMVRTLLLIDRERGENGSGVEALVAFLLATGQVSVTTTTSADRLRSLGDVDVVIASTTRGPLTEEQEAALCAFVEAGGGLLSLGATAEAWSANPAYARMVGATPGQRAPRCELIAYTATDHPLTRRLDASFALDESCYLFDAPADAEVLLRTTWRYTAQPLAYVRTWGAGGVFYTSLGCAEQALAHPVLQQVLFRGLRAVGGWRETGAVRVASLGYGAIGFEHGNAMQHTAGLDFALVCDRNPARLEQARAAFPDLRTTTDAAEVASDASIDAVIVGTPPNTHAALALQMLEAGKHVVVEKPFCMTTAEADTLISAAARSQRTLTVYQNRRWDPDFLAIQQVARDGMLGEIFHVETFIGSYSHPCDFWHSHEPVSGGVFYDWGSHYLDWVLTLLPDAVQNVRASAHKRVWHDVTNADQATLSIRFAGGQEASFMHSDVAALLKPKWYILGTRGALIAEWRYESVKTRRWSGDLIEERLAPSESLPALTLATPAPGGAMHQLRLALPEAPHHPFHRNLADHLLVGEPLAVQPTSSRRNIAVMEAAAYSAAHDAEVVPLAAHSA